MIDRTKALVAGAAVTAALGFGALGTAAAQDGTPTPAPTPDQEQAPEPGQAPDRSREDCPEPGGGSEDSNAEAAYGAMPS
jgi:hypothetical protein